jgi:glutathione S-transferase
MITIYGIKGAHVSRLRAALVWKELDFEHVSVNLGQRSDEFKNLTPAETIPVLQDGDVVVSESLAAAQYLDDKYPEKYNMFGNTYIQKAKIKNICWAIDRIGHYLPPLYIEKFGMAEGMKSNGKSHRVFTYTDAQKADLQGEISYRLGKLLSLKSSKFFESQFSMADASMLGLLRTLQWLGLDVGEWKAWSNDLMQDSKIASMFPADDLQGVREI